MTVAALTSSREYNGNGVTTVFAAPFRYLSTAHLEVKAIAADGTVTTLALGVGYTATPGPTDAGGAVTMAVAPAAGTRLRIKRVTPRSQSTDYTTGDDFPAEAHEAGLDRAMLVDQEQDDKILDTAARALLWPEGEVASVLGAKATFAGKYFAGDASGNPVPASGTGNDAALRTDLATGSGGGLIGLLLAAPGAILRSLADVFADDGSVMHWLPLATRVQVRLRTSSANLATLGYLDAAADHCAAAGIPLHFPRGTYCWTNWAIDQDRLTVTTAGRGTTIKQLDTGGSPVRMITVTGDHVALWPGGAVTADGSIDTIPGNATEQNHFVIVEAQAGTTINTFTCGDIDGRNIGGDVVTVYSPGGTIGHCKLGTIHGRNIYRFVVAITGGSSGEIDAVIQAPGAGVGCGLGVLDWEPDPANTSAPDQWTVGLVRGRTITIAGDPGVRLGDLRIGQLHLDYDAYGVSNPAYDEVGINVGSNPDLFLNAIRCRNWRTLHIGAAFIKGHPRSAIQDLGVGGTDDLCDSFRIETLVLDGVCTAFPVFTNGEIQLQKLRKFSVGTFVHVNKPNLDNATFLGGADTALIEVEGGEIKGRVCNSMPGAFLFANVKQTVLAGQAIFRNVGGQIRLRGGSGSGNPSIMFENCPVAPVIEDWTGGTTPISGTTTTIDFTRSTIDGVYRRRGFLNVAGTAPYPNHADDAAAAAGGVALGDTYRTGSALKIRVA